MSWLSTLFVNPKNISSIVDAGISAGDKMFYTDEEKVEDRLKTKEWYLALLDSMKPFNVAMRLLAVGVFAMWAIHLLISTGFWMKGFISCDTGALVCSYTEMSNAMDARISAHINGHFQTIIMFYFGAAGLNSVVATVKGGKK